MLNDLDSFAGWLADRLGSGWFVEVIGLGGTRKLVVTDGSGRCMTFGDELRELPDPVSHVRWRFGSAIGGVDRGGLLSPCK